MSRESTIVNDPEGSLSLTAGMRSVLRQLGDAYTADKAVRAEQVNTNVKNRLLRSGLIRLSNPTGTFVIITDKGKRVINELS